MKEEKKAKQIDHSELSSFCGQVALILEAGLPLFDGLSTLAESNQRSPYADMYAAVAAEVTAGSTFEQALEADSRWPAYMKEMAGVGERTGQLEQVMRSLEAFYAREERIRSSVKSAATYPLTLGAMLALIVLIMLWKVLPVFNEVLSSMGMSGDGSGGAMLRLGTILGWVVLVLVAVVFLAVLVTVVLLKTKHAGAVRQSLLRMFPPAGRLARTLGASRVAGVLSMMLSSGFSSREALERTEGVLSNDPQTREKVKMILDGMDHGQEFAEAVEKADLFDPVYSRMILMGAATAREDQVFGRIATACEEQGEAQISRLISIIEPTLVAILTVVIGAVLLSVMFPMAGMLSSM